VTESDSPKRSRRPVLLVLLLFFAPLATAFLLYYSGTWRPSGTTQNGDLIHPARPLPVVSLRDDQGNALAKEFLQHLWSLIYVGDGQCDTRCRAALADMQRARELLGKDILRVQSVFLATANCCDGAFLHSTFPKLIVARADDQAAPLLAQFPSYSNVPVATSGRIYIVDPLGNLMMSYSADATGIGMYNDLKKLLDLSHIG
jgi:hypothetical protein